MAVHPCGRFHHQIELRAFMSMSLRDQLLQAGLVSEKQAREAERQLQRQQQGRQQQPKPQRSQPTAEERAAQRRALAKAARDAELNRRQQEKAERRARHAQIKQLIELNRLPRGEGEEYYSFVDHNKIRRIVADHGVRERIVRGELMIARCEGRYELVPAETAARIRERDERAVIAALPPPAAPAAPADDPYADYAVPDDLMW
jgi:uncharacterized protein YaiL (DUF2058 family)